MSELPQEYTTSFVSCPGEGRIEWLQWWKKEQANKEQEWLQLWLLCEHKSWKHSGSNLQEAIDKHREQITSVGDARWTLKSIVRPLNAVCILLYVFHFDFDVTKQRRGKENEKNSVISSNENWYLIRIIKINWHFSQFVARVCAYNLCFSHFAVHFGFPHLKHRYLSIHSRLKLSLISTWWELSCSNLLKTQALINCVIKMQKFQHEILRYGCHQRESLRGSKLHGFLYLESESFHEVYCDSTHENLRNLDLILRPCARFNTFLINRSLSKCQWSFLLQSTVNPRNMLSWISNELVSSVFFLELSFFLSLGFSESGKDQSWVELFFIYLILLLFYGTFSVSVSRFTVARTPKCHKCIHEQIK